MRDAIRKVGFVLLCVLAAAIAPIAMADPPSPEAFFRDADLADAKLSPSGRWLALAAAGEGLRVGLIAIDLLEKESPRLIARLADADVFDFEWVNDDRLVFRIVDRESGSGDQRFGAGLFSVRRTGDELRLLIGLRREFIVERRLGPEPLAWNHTLLFVPRNGGDEVVVGELPISQGKFGPVTVPKRLNVVTQRVASLARGAPEHSRSWLFDRDGEPRLVSSVHAGQTTVYRRAAGQSEWARIAEFPTLKPAFTPRFIDGDGELYVTVATGPAQTSELRRFDFSSGKVEAEPVVRTPGFDFVGAPVVDPESGRILGLRITTDAETTHWFDPRMKQAQSRADARFPGRINRLTCGRCGGDDMVVLVRSWNDRDPGSFSVYRPAADKREPIGRVRKAIDPAQMAALDLHRFAARDGLQIPVWVTMPKRAKPEQPGPAVLLVHGGPWVRGGTWQWKADAQFLASRGYVVIEPEFRGSSGYGRTHFVAGWKQWGRAMQDDLADAVKWAVAKGWVDPKRVCIAGAGYGGYATLMGLIRDPELYRCGAAWIAATDPRLLFQWSFESDWSDESRLYDLPSLIGDPVADAAALAAVAPVEHAAQIKTPLLLAFGGNDRRVPLQHGTKMREALRAAGHEPQWIVYPEEGHGWLKVENRIDFYKRLERFLAEHLQ